MKKTEDYTCNLVRRGREESDVFGFLIKNGVRYHLSVGFWIDLSEKRGWRKVK